MRLITIAAASAALIALGCSEPDENDASRGPEVRESPLLVSVDGGTLRGVAENGTRVFRNIPFAAPPVGEFRWRPPQPAAGWEGEREASRFGAVCPQVLRKGYSLEVLSPYPLSEDCLNLNVWTPAGSSTEPRPVMVWILPGSFLAGAAQMPRYSGEGLAQQDVVVVTFNYRLGMLGQFAHPALTATQPDEPLGNYALMDQIAALQWVQRNIAAFGGDPDNVTIFGMSAGGVSVNYLMTTPSTRHLFHRAASQSSGIRVKSPRHIFDDVGGVQSLQNEGVAIAERLGVRGDDSAATAAALRAITMEQILDYQANNMLGSGGSLNPVVDGRLVVESVGSAFEQGRAHPIPYLAGATDWEGSLVTFLDEPDLLLQRFSMTPADAKDIYGDVDSRTVIDNLEVDLFFGSQRYFVKHHAENGHPSWLYFFSRVLESQVGTVTGAAHGAEMRYVMKTLTSLEGPAVMPAHGTRISSADQAYADMVSAYWIDFAETGNPNGDARPEWPAFTAEQDVLLEFQQGVPVAKYDFLEKRMDFFEAHFDAGKL